MRAPSLFPPLFIFDALAFGHGLDGEAVVLRALSVCIVILNNVKNILLPRRVYQNIYTFAIVIPVSLILGKPYYYLFMETKMTQMIPLGRSKEDIKVREQIIKDFYANWIAEHPNKKVLNIALGKYICVKFLSINETYEKASRSYESTLAVLKLTEILKNATLIEELPAKRNTRNQKQFEKLLVMQYENIKLTVGLQRSNQDLVQYCITVPQISIQTKPSTQR